MHEVLVTIATYTTAAEAYVTKGLLESAGVSCYVFDENIVNMNLFYSNAVGGVKLKVPSSQLHLAKEILGENRDVVDETKASDEYNCPACGSRNVANKKLPWFITIFASVLMSFPVPYVRKKLECHDCGYSWREKGKSKI